jgi:hypothetical protein
VFALLAALVPAVIFGRQATAQDSSGTPEASPAAADAQTVAGLETAAVVPADSLLFATLTVDPASGQITQSHELLDRAGLGDLVDSLVAEAVPETIGVSSDDSPVDTTTGAGADATPAAGGDEPDLGAILDGEVAVAVSDQVIEALGETFGETLDEGADAVAGVVEDVPAAEATLEPAEVIKETGEDSEDAAEADDEDEEGPLDNIGSTDVDADEDDADDADDAGSGTDSPAAEIEPLPSDEVVAAEETGPSGLVVVVRPADPDAAAAEIDAMLLESSRANDTAIEETEASGTTIRFLPPSEFESDGIAVARLGDVFVVSGTPDDLAPYAAVFAGEAPALDADPAFVRARTEMPDDFLAFGFVNGPAIVTALEPVLAEASEELAAAGLPAGGLTADQLAQLRAYNAFIVRADTPGFRFETAAWAAEGETLPALPEGGEVTLDGQVPGDSLVFVDGFELGATAAPSLDAVALLIAQLAMEDPDAALLIPEGATDAEKIAAVYDLLGRIVSFNPRTQLIDQMTGEWAFALTVRSLTDPSGVGAVFTSGVNDPAQVLDATTKLAAYVNVVAVALTFTADNPVQVLANTEAGAQTETVGDGLTQVITIPIPPSTTGMDSDTPVDQTEAGEPVPTVRLQWGIVDGQFVFGVNEGFTDLVEGAASGTLADNPRYQAIMAELPDPSNGVFYLDLGQLITLLEPLVYGDPGALPACDTSTDDGCTATPVPSTSAELPDPSGIEALAAVAYTRGDVRGVSALLMIGELRERARSDATWRFRVVPKAAPEPPNGGAFGTSVGGLPRSCRSSTLAMSYGSRAGNDPQCVGFSIFRNSHMP